MRTSGSRRPDERTEGTSEGRVDLVLLEVAGGRPRCHRVGAGLSLPSDEPSSIRVEPKGQGFVARRIGIRIAEINGRTVPAEGALLRPGDCIQAGGEVLVALERRTTRAGAPFFALGRFVAGDGRTVEALARVARLARSDAPVLVTGESGTGKEVLAQTLHTLSDRGRGPLVALNCAALPEALAESELFGHVRGAFSGAFEARVGLLEQASGGTLFLDEVGELSAAVQAKLLRALDTGEVRRVGGHDTRQVDVRIVSATHRDLPRLCREGRFRLDLLFRLRVLHVDLPPLRERPGDLAPLCDHLLTASGQRGLELSEGALDRLRRHSWPGNVRELRNVVQRAAAFAVGPLVGASELQLDVGTVSMPAPERLVDRVILDALVSNDGHRARAREALGIPRSTFYRWIKRNEAVLAEVGL